MVLTYYFGDDSFDYEIDIPIKVKYEILAENYGVSTEQIKNIDDDFDLFADDRFEEIFEDELKNYYEDDAYEEYKDSDLYNRDKLGYYGLKQSDFI